MIVRFYAPIKLSFGWYRLPVSQGFFSTPVASIHILWGESARLVKAAGL